MKKTIEHIKTNIKMLSNLNLFVSTKEDRKKENARKLFHVVGGLFLPFFVLLLPQKICILLNIVVLIPLLIIDYNNWILFFNKIPKGNLITQLLRDYECVKGKLTGLSWLLIGTLIVITVFNKYIVSLSIAILIIGDASAALIGKNFGRIKICGKKTLEGTLSFIISGCLVYVCFYNFIFPANIIFNTYFVLFSIIVSAIVELFSKNINIDDNFALPLSFCLSYKIFSMFLIG